MQYHGISIPQDRLEQFCRKRYIRRLSRFGSILRDDFGPESEIDVLVEFEPDHTPGLIRMAGIEIEISEMLGRKVDLRSPAELSRHFRDQVLGRRNCNMPRRDNGIKSKIAGSPI